MHSDHPPPYESCRTGSRRTTPFARDPISRTSPSESAFNYGHNQPTTDSFTNTKSSLDITQRIERKLAEYNASQNAFKRWLFEILCWLASALAMGAIIGIYAYLNGKSMSQAGKLLTYTNALGKVASAALIVPTSEALGQLKWNWFSKSRTMWDFEIFDKASRGPLGALMLLFRTKGRSLAALGAILIVLLLAIDTFFQQVVELPDQWTLQSISGTIPRVIEYRPEFELSYMFGYESTSEDRHIAPMARDFFYRNGSQPVSYANGTRPDIPLSCPTSNCTWPLYETLAVCSSCSDVSDVLNSTFACLNTTIEWSAIWEGPLDEVPYQNGTVCGHFINATSIRPTLLSGYVLPANGNSSSGEALVVRAIPLTDFDSKAPSYGTGSINYKGIRYPILDALISSARNGRESVYRNEPPIVHECMLAWCVHTMKSSYEWGTYNEDTVSTYFEPVRESDPWPWQTWDTPRGTWYSYTEHLSLTPQRNHSQVAEMTVINDTYRINNYTQTNIMNYHDDFFPSFYTSANIDTKPVLRYQNYAMGPSVYKLNWNPWEHPNNITHHMERLATAMTNKIRSTGSTTMLEGKAYQMEPYISIQWGWLVFPLTLLVLSLVFLVSTIVKTSGDSAMGIWKNSAMPTLIYSLPKETQPQFASSSAWSSDRGAPKKTRIRMLPNMGWRVSGHSYSPRLPSGERVPRGWI
ncbi:hypothetical protein HBH56_028790 [Parastagonospora nodorum]|uniref:DUF3176 domain containing protein n=1 Tax=Phaeosphaeria nodorum (strain SN15 / ATCC MYA-4574 / FGSC 10173) TaxID=321614 RepID=A0A7U2F5K9_PHANO|nr:hypothetical protein HBH56_028790 [Parastagonospora nodorum]QRC99143.1 hypothetical protein JI435_064810 [Parastagonospora nodorum SN15]KAH3934296.1 hypothetical protein HBH54_053250 [Parastagonospora nodorum]KAH4141961.1 hypothetical protein HBH45_063540 [Parastagonospora nodorum]KAH4150972.1 hypothetical protein HBH44_171840 [Parastagonospora nodorum]